DVVHDVFVWLWSRRESVIVTGRLDVYLLSAVRNRIYESRRHRKVVLRFEEESGADLSGPPPGVGTQPSAPDAQLEEDALRETVRSAVEKLSPRQQLLISLRWHDQLSYDEVAQVLGISPGAARVQMTRALQQLRPWLQSERED